MRISLKKAAVLAGKPELDPAFRVKKLRKAALEILRVSGGKSAKALCSKLKSRAGISITTGALRHHMQALTVDGEVMSFIAPILKASRRQHRVFELT